MSILSVTSLFTDRIAGYRADCQKVMDAETKANDNGGLKNVLMCFLYKLEFFLKNGFFPVNVNHEMVGGEGTLPPELKKLRTFLQKSLENTENKLGATYILEDTSVWRYRFTVSELPLGKWGVTVSRERRHSVDPIILSGGCEWRVVNSQSCTINVLLDALNHENKPECKPTISSAFPEDAKFDPRLLYCDIDKEVEILANHHLPLTDTSLEGVKNAFEGVKKNLSKKPFQYLFSCENIENADELFRSSFPDLERASSHSIVISGVKIPANTLDIIIKQITNGIIDPKSARFNKWDEECVDSICKSLKSNSAIESEQLAAVRSVLSKPQFPLALLSVVAQKLCMQVRSILRKKAEQNNLLSSSGIFDHTVINSIGDFTETRSFSIKLSPDGEKLDCGSEYLLSYLSGDDKPKVSAVKQLVCYSVSEECCPKTKEIYAGDFLERLGNTLGPTMQIAVSFL